MKTVALVTIVVAIFSSHVVAQQHAVENPKPGVNFDLPEGRVQELLKAAESSQAKEPEVSLGKKVRARGPLVQVFKGKTVLDAPKRLLRLINPFAPSQKTDQLERTANLSPRAWTSTVGLNPGGTAFPDATTHESSMGLVTISRR